MATTKFYLDMRGRAQDGKGSILISIFHNKSTSTIPTGIRVSIKEWDGEKIVRRDDASILNAKLSSQKSKIDTAIAALSLAESLDSMSATDIKHSICDKKESKDRRIVSVLFDEYMNTGKSDGTKDIYATTLKKVKSFGGEKIKIDQITVKWLFDFEQYLSGTQCINGRSIYLRSLRAVCKYAYKTGATSLYPFDNFKIKSEPTRKRSITVEKLRQFISYKVDDRTAMFRDYFMLMFYLIGAEAIDVLMAPPSAICDGRFEYIRRKTHKLYSIKIEPEAQAIIDKYRGKEHLLAAMDYYKYHKSFLKEMNAAIKNIGDEYEMFVEKQDTLFPEYERVKGVNPIVDGVSSKWARHTWATLAFELGISSDVVSLALGHAPLHRTTFIYIKPDQKKVDDANRKVIDYLLGV